MPETTETQREPINWGQILENVTGSLPTIFGKPAPTPTTTSLGPPTTIASPGKQTEKPNNIWVMAGIGIFMVIIILVIIFALKKSK